MRSHLRRTITLGILAVIAAVATADGAPSFVWTPKWSFGDYWIVESPRHRFHVDPLTGETTSEVVGVWRTRFTVVHPQAPYLSLERVIHLLIEPSTKPTFGEHVEDYIVRINLDTLNVTHEYRDGLNVLGNPIHDDFVRAHDKRPPREMHWCSGFHDVSAFPESLVLCLPALEPNGFRSAIIPTVGEEYMEQAVTIEPDGRARVRVFAGAGGPANLDKVDLLFQPSSPWYEVERDGVLINKIVEVGTRPVAPPRGEQEGE